MGIQLSGGDELAAMQPGAFWAKITGNASGTNRYAWTQIDDGDTAAFDVGLADGFAATGTSSADGAPAYEVNGRTDVATGTRVLLYPMGDLTYYGFAAPATEAAGAANYLAPVRVATTTSGTLSTSFENGDTVDGVTLVTGDRILIKNQSTGSENGVYVVASSGAPSRATDADSGAELFGALVPVVAGTTNGDSLWMCTNDSVPTVGSTALTFVKIGPSSASGVTGSGTGLCLAYWNGVGSGITDLSSNTNISLDPGTGTLTAIATGTGVDGIYATRISCDSVNAEHLNNLVSASLNCLPFGGDDRSALQLFASPYTIALYASTTITNTLIVQTDSSNGYLRLNGTAYMHNSNTGYTGTPGPGFTTSGGIVTGGGSGSYVGTADNNAFTGTNSFSNTTTFTGSLLSQSAGTFTPASAATVPLTVKGAASQSSYLQRNEDSTGALLGGFDDDGVYRGPADFGEWTSPPPPPPPPPPPVSPPIPPPP